MNLKELTKRSHDIRERYHTLELQYHGSKWSTEEDALAFLTDAALVGRLTMDHEGRWPSEEGDLSLKIGECVWWLAILADEMHLSFEECVNQFITAKEEDLREIQP